MAKELPYFKFEPNEWENGNIQMLSREDKGLFIDVCSMYWSRLGDLPLKLAVQKLCGGNATALKSLCEEGIIEVSDDKIYIKFLSLQLLEFENTSATNAKNAKEGWEKRRKEKALSERNATALKSQSEIDAIREEEIRLKKIRENETRVENSPYGDGRLHFMCKEFWSKNTTKYETEFYKSFLEYWTAPIQKGAKKGMELWRDEKTFQLSSRLNTSYNLTWKKNEQQQSKFSSEQERKNAIAEMQRRDIEILTGNTFKEPISPSDNSEKNTGFTEFSLVEGE